MAFSGETVTDRDLTFIPSTQPLVFDWLDAHEIDWCVYSDDLSFFTLFQRLWPKILLDSKHFRKFSTLTADVLNVSGTLPFPKVVFIEPSFLDSPIHPDHDPNDDHPTLPIGLGEDFLRQVYQALTPPQNLTLWKQLVMIVTFDEHGGFYDHVSPLFPVSADCGPGNRAFRSTGARVPAFVISPFTSPGRVYQHNLDHTSMLEFLAEWLTPSRPYSLAVAGRLAQPGFNTGLGRGKLSDVLDLLPNPRQEAPNEPIYVIRSLKSMPGKKMARTPNELAFEQAAGGMLQKYPAEFAQKYPALLHWHQNR
jgi:phospholipase C